MAVEFGKWEKIERKELTPPIPFGVEKIEILNLDEGSKNDGTETFGNYGMIYGKSYKLRVSKFAHNIAPKNKNDIKWQVSYLGKGNVLTLTYIQKTGDEIVFNCNKLEYCGRTFSFYAFVKESGKEQDNKAYLEVFCHNRFRWFDKTVFESELLDRTDNGNPFLINQNGTSLCGMACIFYLFAKEQPEKYKKFARDLFRKGEATFNNYTATPSKELFEKKKNDKNYPYNGLPMPTIDFITLAGVRNTENSFYKGGDEQVMAINWPNVMTKLCEKLLGYKIVKSKGCYDPIKPIFHPFPVVKNPLSKIEDINEQLAKGYKLILMVDSDMIDDRWDISSVDLHWVVLEKNISFKKKGFFDPVEVSLSVYSWGEIYDITISLFHFNNNYNGYIKVK